MQDQFGESLTSLTNELFDVIAGIDRIYNTMASLLSDASVMAQYVTPEQNAKAHSYLLDMIEKLDAMLDKVKEVFTELGVEVEQLTGVVIMGRDLISIRQDLEQTHGRISPEVAKDIRAKIDEWTVKVDDLKYTGMQRDLYQIYDEIKTPELTQALDESQRNHEHHTIK